MEEKYIKEIEAKDMSYNAERKIHDNKLKKLREENKSFSAIWKKSISKKLKRKTQATMLSEKSTTVSSKNFERKMVLVSNMEEKYIKEIEAKDMSYNAEQKIKQQAQKTTKENKSLLSDMEEKYIKEIEAKNRAQC